MTVWQKFKNVFLAVSMILIGVAMLFFGEKAYMAIIGLFSLWLEILGFRKLIFYFSMGRYMVGGRNILFRGIIFIDFGIFTGSLVWVPKGYILMYLAGMLAFSGLVNIIGAREAKRIESSWKFKTFQGVIKILFAISCMIFMRSEVRVVNICAIGFILSALMSIANTFRRHQVITID